MNIYERYGRLQEEYDQECTRHVSTISLLRRILSGDVAVEDVAVTDDNQWSVREASKDNLT